jgi:CarD family transcriptional regulator
MLGVGDVVVYAAHGVGSVVAREQKLVAGTERDCVVVDLAAGLRVTLPLEEAAERLRGIVDDAEFVRVGRTLATEPGIREGSWTRRVKETKAKLASGTPVELAEVVRDGGVARLSPVERSLYLQARQLLVREICSARDCEQDDADAWIEAQMGFRTEGGADGFEEATSDVREVEA